MAKIKKIGAVGLSALIVASAPNIVGLQSNNTNVGNVAYAAESNNKLDFSDGTSIELEGTPSINYGKSGDRVRTVDLNLKVNGYKADDVLFLYEGFDFVNKDGEDVSKTVSIFQKTAEGTEIKLKGSDVTVGKIVGHVQEDGTTDYAIVFNENIENLENPVISISARYDVNFPVRYADKAEQNAGKLPIELYAIGANGQDFEKLYETSIPQLTDEFYPVEGSRLSTGPLIDSKNDRNGVDFRYNATAIVDDVKAGEHLKLTVDFPETMNASSNGDLAKLYDIDFVYLKQDFDKGNLNRGYLSRQDSGQTLKADSVNYDKETKKLVFDFTIDKDYDKLALETPEIAVSTDAFDKVFASKDGALNEESFINQEYELSGNTRQKNISVKSTRKNIQVPDAVLSAIGDYSTTNEREEEIPFKTSYKGDGSLEFEKQEVKTEGKNGKNKLIDTLDANGKIVDTKTEVINEPVDKLIHVGNEKEKNEEIPFKVIKRKNPELPAGTKETKISDGEKGSRTLRYRYDVDRETGALVGDGLKISDEVTKKPVDEIWEYNDDVVRKNNEDYTPNVIEKTIYVGDDIPADLLVINKENLPEGTKITYKPGTEPDNAKVGDYDVVVVTTYPDGSSDETPTVVHVIEERKDEPVNDNVEKTVNPKTKDITVKVGTKVEPNELVTNVDELPNGTKFTYKSGTEPDINKVGKYNVTIVSTYPDGKVVETPAVVNVVDVEVTTTPIKDNKEKVKPTAQEKTVKIGTEVTAKELITNTDKLPGNTKYTFKEGTAPDISKVGDYDVVVVTTYPDGSSDETPTIVHVIDESKTAASTQTQSQSGNPLSVQTGGAVAGGAGIAAILAGVAASYFNNKKKNK